MVRTATSRRAGTFECAECGWESPKWVGRCGGCRAWDTVEPQMAAAQPIAAGPVTSPARPISQVQADPAISRPTGVAEVDRVLGGGIVPGAVVLLAGEPGVGKSTLLLEVAARTARAGATTLYVTGEESAAQVRRRAERTDGVDDRLYLAAEVDIAAVLGHVDSVSPDLLVVDSIQTMAGAADGVPGGTTQVRAVANALVRVAKERHLPVVLVGHVTKDGSIAGPRALEHIVDVVLQFEGEHGSRLRLLRAVKNRFGPVDEVGCFDLLEDGIVEVADPTGLFISHHAEPKSGTCITVTLEGRRPLLAEVQTLVTYSATPQPRRAVSGLDSARLAMLLAVLQRHAGLDLAGRDVYAATVGGAVLRSPAADLATAMSLGSAAVRRPLPSGTVVIGEVGLAGELRRVPAVRERLAEAARLGFRHAVVPRDTVSGPGRIGRVGALSVIECSDVCQALSALRLTNRPADPGAPGLRAVTGG